MALGACATQLPEAARQAAIMAVCELPIYEGEDLCESVEVIHVQEEEVYPAIEGIQTDL